MQRSEIEKMVIHCIAESLALEEKEIQSKSILVDNLGADSLDFMDIMFHFEDAFQIKMQRESLDFIAHIDLDRKDAVIDDYLTKEAKKRLMRWMPDLDQSIELRPIDLTRYLTIESLVIVIESILTANDNAKLSAENV